MAGLDGGQGERDMGPVHSWGFQKLKKEKKKEKGKGNDDG